MPKIDRAHKNYLTSSMICIGRHVGGHTLALHDLQHGGQNYFLTIIPPAQMGSESIPHEAEGQMGY